MEYFSQISEQCHVCGKHSSEMKGVAILESTTTFIKSKIERKKRDKQKKISDNNNNRSILLLNRWNMTE